MHSYGGLVGSETIPEELTYVYRKTRGLSGGVIQLYHLNAFIPRVGKSVLGAFWESPNNDIKETKYNSNSMNVLVSSMALLSSTTISRIPMRNPGNHNSFFNTTMFRRRNICENHQTVLSKYQDMFATTVGAQIAICNAGYSAMLSQTKLLSEKMSAVTELAIQEANQSTQSPG